MSKRKIVQGEGGAGSAERRGDRVGTGEPVGVHPTLINQWKRALLDGASGVFERGSRKAPEID